MSIARLLRVASAPLSDSYPASQFEVMAPELIAMLRKRNGFYALEGAVHVFPSGQTHADYSLEGWNAPDLWRQAYDLSDDRRIFFAENAFGEQFALGDIVELFNLETGNFESLARDLEAWALTILEDNSLSGYPLARQWQIENNRLETGQRLVPKKPFVLGGEYSIENLSCIDAVTGMLARAELASQIRNMPDGTRVDFRLTD